MNEESKVTLYNVATFDPNSPNAEEGKLDFTNFVKTYSHMYYFQTCQWVEQQIEKYLREEAPDVEAFLKIFAWKTNKIDQKQSLCKKDIVYIAGEDKKKNWNFNKKDRVASAVTRHGLIEKETVKKENGEEETKTLYDFLNTAVDLSKSYRSLKENDKKEKQ